ncbi:hypothetical protein QCA50_016938 [Cerrena zonata]|uniref:Uncharacterized protein n=1 Tax=Cerrena zonata TaxID=2478898 RepID=A0AAW0FRS5_9APHY
MGVVNSACMFFINPILRRTLLFGFHLPTTEIVPAVFQYSLFPELSTSDYLSRLCEERPDFIYARRSDELAKCKITHLELYKCTKGSLHEFVLAHIVHYSCQPVIDTLEIQRRVVRVERAVCEPSGANDDTNYSTKDIITIYESSEKALEIDDGKAKCCYVVRFIRPFEASILNLAVAADTLHQIAPNDIPFKYMDYWFANNLCRLVVSCTDYPQRYIVVQKHSRRNFRAGYFKGIPVLDGDSRVVIREDLQVSVDDLRELISQNPDVFSQGPLSGDQPAPNPSPYDPKHKRQFAESDVLTKYYKARRQKARSDLNDAYVKYTFRTDTRARRAEEERAKKMEEEKAAKEGRNEKEDESEGDILAGEELEG